jgi:hypothetical protein
LRFSTTVKLTTCLPDLDPLGNLGLLDEPAHNRGDHLLGFSLFSLARTRFSEHPALRPMAAVLVEAPGWLYWLPWLPWFR